MHILYIHQYFATFQGKTGTRSYEFARRWVKQGHVVKMLTTTAQLASVDLTKAHGIFLKNFVINGIDVIAISIPYRQNMGVIKRCFAFAAFTVIALFFTVFYKRYDVIYATSTPITVGIPAIIAKWLRKKKFVFEVRDQWPEIPIEMGIIQGRTVTKMLLYLEKSIYKNAAAITALSPGMAQGIRNVLGKSQKKQITVIPNGCDTDTFSPDIDGTILRKEKGWGDKFVLLHAGAMGKANGLGFIVDVAERLRDKTDILFALAGQGSEKAIIAEQIKRKSLTNIELLGSVAKYKLPEVMAACDVSLVIFANYPILEHNSANKFFDSLSAGKPILLNYSGWQREIIENHKAGLGCRLCDTDEFIAKLIYLYEHYEELKEMGRNARRIALEFFNRDKLAAQALQEIEAVMRFQTRD